MTKRTLRAGAAPFAHLLGGFRAARAEENPEDDTDGRKAKRAEEDKNREEEDARRAEEDQRRTDEDARRAEEDDGVGGDPEPELEDVVDPDDTVDEDKAPEEDDADPKVRKAAKNGRKAERARWSKVLGHAAATGRVAAACQMLASSPMSAKAVIGTLKTLPAESPTGSRHPQLADRMATRPTPRIGADVNGGGAQTFGQAVAAAVSKVRPAKG